MLEPCPLHDETPEIPEMPRMQSPTRMPDWLKKGFDSAERIVADWSEGKKIAAGIVFSSMTQSDNNVTMITATKASRISNDTLSKNQEAIKQKCQQVLDDLDKKISEQAAKGKFACALSLSKGTWPDTFPVYYFELISNKQLTEYGKYIYQELIAFGYVVDIDETRILVSWQEAGKMSK